MKRVIAVCLSSLFVGGASAADLMQVYRDALANDARFSAARAQLEAGQEKVIQGRAGLLPSLGASANTTWNDVDSRTSTGINADARYNSNGYALQLTQPLFRWQNWVQYKQGELQTALADTQFMQARQDLILRVSEAYFNVLNAQDALAAVTQLRTAAAEQLEIARTSFEVGTVTITDVHEAQSRFDLAQAQEIAAQNTLDVSRQTLAQIIGKEPDVLATLREGVALQRPQPDNISDWVSAAERDGLGVQTPATEPRNRHPRSRTYPGRPSSHGRSGRHPRPQQPPLHGTRPQREHLARATAQRPALPGRRHLLARTRGCRTQAQGGRRPRRRTPQRRACCPSVLAGGHQRSGTGSRT